MILELFALLDFTLTVIFQFNVTIKLRIIDFVTLLSIMNQSKLDLFIFY
jgi:hypothetical protein